jgi:beta-N-acetylhexosaminidase
MEEIATEDYTSDASQNHAAPYAQAPFYEDHSRAYAPAATLSPSTRRRRRAPYTRVQRLVIALATLAAVVAAVPLGAYLTLPRTSHQHQQTQSTSTATPASTPTASAAQRETQFINQMISRMSLDEELGQMIMVAFSGTSYNDSLQYMIVNQHASGAILYAGNVETTTQTAGLIAAAQANATIPLFFGVDQEGGLINRLQNIVGPRPSARDIGATNDPTVAYRQGVSDGQILRQMGFNINFAPVVDVQTLSDAAYDATTMWGFEYREYGNTPEKVASFAGAYLNGLQDQGVIASLKHWPGIGGITEDPHQGLPILNRSQADLNKIDFAPYRMLLAQGNVDMIMSTHVLDTAYDPKMPATLSPIMIDQVLRHDLGYQGVVITDALDMGALSSRWSVAQAAVLAVIAGNDLLLGVWSPGQMQNILDALKAAIASGQITRARIDLSVQRILALKMKYGLIKMPPQ